MMPASTNWLARIPNVLMTIAAVGIASLIGICLLTDLPERWGWKERSFVASDHEHGDHEHGDHDHGDHDHGDHEHGDHDHGDHDHGDHEHGDHEHDDHEHGDHDHDDHEHGDHDHDDHAGHDDKNSIELSDQARANMQLKTASVSVGVYTEYIEVPGVITSWPGRTHIAVTSPLTGVLNAIHVSRGELISSGTPLFSLRLTHQDLVNTQEAFLTNLGKLDVEDREIDRLSAIAGTGAIAAKSLLTRKYERDKLMAGVRAARQALLLHGLSAEQISDIERTRELIREVFVYAPSLHEDESLHHDSLSQTASPLAQASVDRLASFTQPPSSSLHPEHLPVSFLVTELEVRRGESVSAGQELLQLSDFSQILIEGQAFQRDGQALRAAADSGDVVQAVMETAGNEMTLIEGLRITYIGTEVGRQSRTLPFYVTLENHIERTDTRGEKRYVSWFYKPGQRLTIRLPVAKIDNAIVVPKDAVAEEGPERYVFVENGDHFDRVPVEVVKRDSINVAVANDGQLWPGQSIVTSGAHQLQMFLKNKSGGIDLHVGHSH